MKKGHNARFIDIDKSLWCLDLGVGQCIEHKSGISGLERSFGISGIAIKKEESILGTKDIYKRLHGIQSRKISILPENLLFFEFEHKKESWVGLFFDGNGNHAVVDEKNIPVDFCNAYQYGDESIVTAWDNKSFGVMVKGKENIKKLNEIYEAFLYNDMAIDTVNHEPLKSGGLMFIIASRAPENINKSIKGLT